jgi:hypothetical protein
VKEEVMSNGYTAWRRFIEKRYPGSLAALERLPAARVDRWLEHSTIDELEEFMVAVQASTPTLAHPSEAAPRRLYEAMNAWLECMLLADKSIELVGANVEGKLVFKGKPK